MRSDEGAFLNVIEPWARTMSLTVMDPFHECNGIHNVNQIASAIQARFFVFASQIRRGGCFSLGLRHDRVGGRFS